LIETTERGGEREREREDILNSNQFGNLRNREVGNSRNSVILLKESKSETTNSL
jgi:hypothetical protein